MYLLGRLTRLIISFILLLLPGYYATNDDTCSFAELQSSRARLQAVKNDILLRLGLKEEPRNPASEEIPDFLEDYEAVKEAVKLNQKHIPCARLDIGTKERRAFSPTAVQRIRPLPRTAEGDECASKKISLASYTTIILLVEELIILAECRNNSQEMLGKLSFPYRGVWFQYLAGQLASY